MSRSYCLSATEQKRASEACFCCPEHTNELKVIYETKLQYMRMNASCACHNHNTDTRVQADVIYAAACQQSACEEGTEASKK